MGINQVPDLLKVPLSATANLQHSEYFRKEARKRRDMWIAVSKTIEEDRMQRNFASLDKQPAQGAAKGKNLAERAKYQFEEDSEDDEMENEIDSNLDALGGATGRLHSLARVTGEEVDRQNKLLEDIHSRVRCCSLLACFSCVIARIVADSSL